MIERIGYPEYILNATELDKTYSGVSETLILNDDPLALHTQSAYQVLLCHQRPFRLRSTRHRPLHTVSATAIRIGIAQVLQVGALEGR